MDTTRYDDDLDDEDDLEEIDEDEVAGHLQELLEAIGTNDADRLEAIVEELEPIVAGTDDLHDFLTNDKGVHLRATNGAEFVITVNCYRRAHR